MGWIYLIIGFLAANGMPHFAFGLAGQTFRSPLGRHTRPRLNVIWGATNFVALTGLTLWQVVAYPVSAWDFGWWLAGFWLGVALFAYFMPVFLPVKQDRAQS